jgi:FMN phosphatase YigB (HAD superfamily)
MIRAIFFDFYSVWTPDKMSYYLALAQQNGPETYKEMTDLVESYYHGKIDILQLADTLRVRLGHNDITDKIFYLDERNISPEIVNFMRDLHAHFLKLGVLADLGVQELKLLNEFNEHNQVLEVIASPLSFRLDVPLMSKEVFAQALNTIGEPLSNCLMVSGNIQLLAYARLLGMGTIQFEGFSKLKLSIDKLVEQDMPK